MIDLILRPFYHASSSWTLSKQISSPAPKTLLHKSTKIEKSEVNTASKDTKSIDIQIQLKESAVGLERKNMQTLTYLFLQDDPEILTRQNP